ncbi:MAG: hypothetical protein M3237_15685 [Actinomycetota bacterium]|nr:hypothetical protein [Actinomycetota bacterium]
MSSTHSEASPADRRVRHQARDAVVVMAFSAGLSSAFAVAMLLFTSLGR